MHRTDLAGYAGMLFDFGDTVRDRFWMRDTPLPLSVAFFRSDGGLVSTDDMVPCLTLGSSCPTYGAAAPYRWALEVPRGRLPGMGIGPGSRLAVHPGRSCHTPLSD
jgi:uncharacterized membrane protein (UPF0127 family)